ncbi:MAG: imidazolonepropionase [Bacilli bacterium]|nr:imidazolonepropionase [Bacilli bacterium]MBN2876352.1 imidazolonepropionase [Bacilli bacterium]
MAQRTLIKNIKYCYTSNESPPVKGHDMSKIDVFDNVNILIEDDRISKISKNPIEEPGLDLIYDASGLICVPGFIDSHTHLVFGGSREHEFAKKLAGVPYLEILKQGGGILSTVKQTKNATFDELYRQAKKSLDEMLLFGVTTIEAKSGYGLSLDTEIKQLEVLRKLNETHPIDIHITYLGAHAFPKEYENHRSDFIQQIQSDLKIIHQKGLAESVDVFCEVGVFSAEETKKILDTAKSLGFKLRVHTDEIESIGGTLVALDLKAKTVDHLMALKEEDMALLAKSDTIANLLPSTSFFLNKEYAPARKMIDAGVALAISSDYNPGSTPSENYQLTMQIAANKLRMVPTEVLTAATVNPAFSLDISNTHGKISVGYKADLVLLDVNNLDYFLYHYGINHTKAVFKSGRLVVDHRQLLEEEL